jgi:hypothetical protein
MSQQMRQAQRVDGTRVEQEYAPAQGAIVEAVSGCPEPNVEEAGCQLGSDPGPRE